MENEKLLQPAESLALIESMINKAKNRFSENGQLYLLWGWTVFFCSLFHFICIKFSLLPHPEMVWMLTWAAVIYQIIFLSKQKKKEKMKTYTDEVEAYVWIAFSVVMMLTIFLMAKNNAFNTMYPMFLVLYGIPTFLSGIVLRFKPLKVGGIICWVLAVIASFVWFEYQLLFLSLAVIAAWIVPGYLLRAKYKNENA